MDTQSEFWQDLKNGKFLSMVSESANGQELANAGEVYNVMKPLITGHDDVESLYCIFLDGQNKILAIKRMFSGTITNSTIYPRELVKSVIEHKASAVILTHNHPSGSKTPSPEDQAITIKVGISLASIDVTMHDHIIIGNGYFSMAEDGWLDKVSERFNAHLSV